MLAAILLLDVLATTAPIHGEVELRFSAGSIEGVGAAAFTGGSDGGDVSAVFFPRPVVDDATPRALQSYLQRSGHVRFTIGGGTFTAPLDGIPGRAAHDIGELHVLLDAEVYVTPSLALTGATGFASDSLRERVPFAAGVALRVGDLRLGVGLAGAGARVSSLPAASGLELAFAADARLVVLEHLDVALAFLVGGHDDAHDLDAQVRLTWYHGGLGLGGGGGAHAHWPDDARSLDVAIGLSWWYSDTLQIALAYTPTWATSDTAGTFQHVGTLSFTARR